jgi:hypothetical protein
VMPMSPGDAALSQAEAITTPAHHRRIRRERRHERTLASRADVRRPLSTRSPCRCCSCPGRRDPIP